MKKILIWSLVAILLGISLWQVQGKIFPWQETYFRTAKSQDFLLENGKDLKKIVFGFENFAADLLWLQTLQYVGGNALSVSFPALAKYLNVITDIDPNFAYAYHFGGLLLPFEKKYQDAVTLLEKGARNLPQEWQFSYDLGFIRFYYLDDSEGAIAAYERCSENLNCPPGAARMAATLRAKSGKVESAFQNLLEQLDYAKAEEIPFLLKKTEEIGKLLVLQEITQVLPPRESIAELMGKKVPEEPKILALIALLEKLLGEKLVDGNGRILPELTKNPFAENPYIWEREEKIIRPQSW